MDREAGSPQLGLWSATALVVGHTIGVGIFLTPAELIGALGSPALTFGLWLVCGAPVLAGASTFGELAARYPQAGGSYVYLQQAWGERVAFLYGWQSPDALFHAFATFGALMSPDLPLTRRQHEMITTVVSVTTRCFY